MKDDSDYFPIMVQVEADLLEQLKKNPFLEFYLNDCLVSHLKQKENKPQNKENNTFFKSIYKNERYGKIIIKTDLENAQTYIDKSKEISKINKRKDNEKKNKPQKN